jgi:hypothetical protein
MKLTCRVKQFCNGEYKPERFTLNSKMKFHAHRPELFDSKPMRKLTPPLPVHSPRSGEEQKHRQRIQALPVLLLINQHSSPIRCFA